jgi:hypothetical protein
MNTLTAQPEDELDDSPDTQLPGRPRRKLLNRTTAPLLVLLIAAAGFLVGIEVEKGHDGGTAATAAIGASGSRPGGFSAAGFGAGGGAPGGSGAKTASTGASSRFSGAPGGGFGGAASAGGATTGTISSISGKTIYLKTTSGDTIKVDLTSATSLKKNLKVTRNSVRPGDAITVEGITGSGGSIKASSISDSGDS